MSLPILSIPFSISVDLPKESLKHPWVHSFIATNNLIVSDCNDEYISWIWIEKDLQNEIIKLLSQLKIPFNLCLVDNHGTTLKTVIYRPNCVPPFKEFYGDLMTVPVVRILDFINTSSASALRSVLIDYLEQCGAQDYMSLSEASRNWTFSNNSK